MDLLDKQLIELLEEDARKSSDIIARKLKVSPATVRRRIRKLIQDGTMRIAAIVDPAKVGLPLAAILAIDVDHEKLESVIENLAKQPEINWFSTTTGRFDIIALARFPSTDALSQFVQKRLTKIEGVKDSETFVCLHMQ